MWWDFPRYVSVGEKKEKATRKLKALQKKNPNIKPVMIQGSAIAKTWWGKSWNRNPERYADYSNLRKANVHDLISEAVEDKTRDLLQKAGRKSSRVIEDTDLTKSFGIEMEDHSETGPAKPSRRREEPVRKKAAKTPTVTKKTVRKRKPAKEEPTSKPSAAAARPEIDALSHTPFPAA